MSHSMIKLQTFCVTNTNLQPRAFSYKSIYSAPWWKFIPRLYVYRAGAGNAQLEVLVAVLQRMGYDLGIDLYKMLDASDIAERDLIKKLPTIGSTSIVSGLSGVFSGYLRPVIRIASEFSIDPRDLFFELGRRKVVAGQEDLIIDVASEMSKEN